MGEKTKGRMRKNVRIRGREEGEMRKLERKAWLRRRMRKKEEEDEEEEEEKPSRRRRKKARRDCDGRRCCLAEAERSARYG